MRIKLSFCAMWMSLALACGGERDARLLGGPESAGAAGASGADAGTDAASASRTDPILEGRKYRIQLPGGSGDEFITHEVSFDGAPRVVPEIPVPGFAGSGSIPASSMIALSCASDIVANSEIIPPDFDQEYWTPNPGTPTTVEGGRLSREMPGWSSLLISVASMLNRPIDQEESCDPFLYWKQEMNLCVAHRYLELAEAVAPYEIYGVPLVPPRAKVPADDDQTWACEPTAGEHNSCSQLGISLQPASTANSPERIDGIRAYVLQLIKQGETFGTGYPERGSLSEGEYLEVLLPLHTRAVARFPVQETADQATLALLAVNYFLAAQDAGQAFIECQLDEGPLAPDMRWVDTYDHRAIRVNELVVTDLVDAMEGSVEAAERAQSLIMASANDRVSGDSSERAHQLFWRARANSRLECVHAWADLAPSLFQDEAAEPDELDAQQLYPVFPWNDSSPQVMRAEQLIRDAQINPELVVSGGTDALWSALRASLLASMPYSFRDVSDPGDSDAMLASLGIDRETLRSAAFRILDANRALGRPIVTLDGQGGVSEARPIEVPGQGGSGHHYAHGVQRSKAAADPIYLYARSIGVDSDNGLAQSSGLPPFSYRGVAGGLATSEKILQRLAETYGIPDGTELQPFFTPANTTPANTTAELASDRDLVTVVQSGIAIAHQIVPEALWLCPNGFMVLHSDQPHTQTPEVWRGEAGLACATTGAFGEVACDPEHYRVPFAAGPVIEDSRSYTWSAYGKFALGGTLDMAGIEPGERIYVTRLDANGVRRAIVGVTVGAHCNYHPFGDELLAKVNECLAPDAEEPGEPAICCEGLPCNLKVPLEDSLQTTPPREIESSFMHYLALAREAATRADLLGEELFRQGLEMDIRAEGAREELEDLCGGVINVGRLGPKPCTSDDQCCSGDDCAMSCMAESGLSDDARYCTGGTPTEAIQSSALAECVEDTDCGDGFRCVGDGDVRFCATVCDPANAGMPCGSECIAAASGPFCATSCDSDADCTTGMACRPSGDAGKICSPKPTDDLQSVEQCLGVGEDALVTAAFGSEALHVWQFDGLPPCVCRAGESCPAPYHEATGLPTCPALSEAELAVPSTGDFETKTIDTLLGFNTGIGGAGTSPTACRALAELRTGVGRHGRTRATNLATVLAQPWTQRSGFFEIASKVDPEYDTFGFLSINYDGRPWISTGSRTTGPVPEDDPPNVRLIQNDQDAYLCETSSPFAGQPLQCKSLNGSGAYRITPEHLVRVTQVMALFAQADKKRRIPTAYKIDLEVQPEGAAAQGFPYALAPGYFQPVPNWLATISPAAQLQSVVELSYQPFTGTVVPVGPKDKIVVNDGSNARRVGEDNTYVIMPQCLIGGNAYWDGRIGCGTIQTENGLEVLQSFQAYANGRVHTGLWARHDSDKGDDMIDAAKNFFGDGRDPKTLRGLLQRIADNELRDSSGLRLEADDPAPILYEGWRNGGSPITVAETMDALELVCLMAANPAGPQVGLQIGCDPEEMAQEPTINGPRDFPKLTTRLRCAADRIDGQLKRMWVPDMPASIAAAIRASEVTDTVPTYGGAYAGLVSELQGSFQAVSESTRTISSQLRAFANELTLAQSTLDQLDNEGQILDWRLVADISAQVAACGAEASNWGSKMFSPGATAFACANAAVQIASAIAIENLQQENLNESKRQALVTLSMQFSDRMDMLQAASERLNTAYTDIQRLQADIQRTRGAAERAAAKVLFLDRDATGRVYNVNTAMRRRMNTLRVRYDEALRDAKRMAFIARRSIEQRLAMSLDELTNDMLLVEAPSTWANSACEMTGIDYDRIRDSNSLPVENRPQDDFSAGYIGDYVTKLENFVESYRFEYPFRDGSDVAVVSVRDDLRRVTAPCDVAGNNLLYHTADMLDHDTSEDVAPQWQDMSEEGTVMTLAPTGSSPKGADLGAEGIASQIRGGMAFEMTAPAQSPDPAARAYWGQDVALEPGLYRLSWYERYGTTDAGCTTAPEPAAPGLLAEAIGLDLESGVLYEEPTLVPLEIGGQPNVAEDFVLSCWRRWTMNVDVIEPQDSIDPQRVRIRFGLQDEAAQVVWAQPMLERVPVLDVENGGGGRTTTVPPGIWFPTTDVLTAPLGACEDTTGEYFQNLFASGASFCEPICPDGVGESCAHFAADSTLATECYHEIKFDIAPGSLERGELVSSIARTNFNYRFSRFGINLVGTGVRDCEQAEFPSSCYASGFIQYSLRHDGPFTVTNHTGRPLDVPLFPARVEHAKALTAERFLTSPLSSADRSLMEDFWRSELRGRPLQGSYTLRIYEGTGGSSVLRMDRLEDVQLVFEYNYWTRAGE